MRKFTTDARKTGWPRRVVARLWYLSLILYVVASADVAAQSSSCPFFVHALRDAERCCEEFATASPFPDGTYTANEIERYRRNFCQHAAWWRREIAQMCSGWRLEQEAIELIEQQVRQQNRFLEDKRAELEQLPYVTPDINSPHREGVNWAIVDSRARLINAVRHRTVSPKTLGSAAKTHGVLLLTCPRRRNQLERVRLVLIVKIGSNRGPRGKLIASVSTKAADVKQPAPPPKALI